MMVPVLLTATIMTWLGYFKTPHIIDSFDPFAGFGIKEYIGLCLAIGVLEEGYCRYLLMDCLFMRFMKLKFWYAAALSAVVFGLMHLGNATPGQVEYVMPQVIGAMFAGLWFAWVYRKVGLYMAILAHGAYDFTCFTSSHMMTSPLRDVLFNIFVFVGGILFIAYLWELYIRHITCDNPDSSEQV